MVTSRMAKPGTAANPATTIPSTCRLLCSSSSRRILLGRSPLVGTLNPWAGRRRSTCPDAPGTNTTDLQHLPRLTATRSVTMMQPNRSYIAAQYNTYSNHHDWGVMRDPRIQMFVASARDPFFSEGGRSISIRKTGVHKAYRENVAICSIADSVKY